MQAAGLYQKAADQGNANAQYRLGCMYYKGQWLEPDFSRAVMWCEKAAAQGNVQAKYRLGVMYFRGMRILRLSAKRESTMLTRHST